MYVFDALGLDQRPLDKFVFYSQVFSSIVQSGAVDLYYPIQIRLDVKQSLILRIGLFQGFEGILESGQGQ